MHKFAIYAQFSVIIFSNFITISSQFCKNAIFFLLTKLQFMPTLGTNTKHELSIKFDANINIIARQCLVRKIY
jgi:hypothetical protein